MRIPSAAGRGGGGGSRGSSLNATVMALGATANRAAMLSALDSHSLTLSGPTKAELDVTTRFMGRLSEIHVRYADPGVLLDSGFLRGLMSCPSLCMLS
jgi:hypothetical protein